MRSAASYGPFVPGALLSLVVHGSALGVLGTARLWRDESDAASVRVKIVEVLKPTPAPAPEVRPEKPPEVAPPKQRPMAPKKIASERTPSAPAPAPKPIQGLAPDSFDPTGRGAVAAPMGNTLMTEDTGERVNEPPPMDADLSADPQLIRASIVTPQYTDAALDATFEGSVIVEVLVDEAGAVIEAELTKKIGYGMDQRILSAARAARFLPRRNRLGRVEAGWTTLKFNMEIP